MFGLVSVHHYAKLGLELPAVLSDIEDNGVHAEVVSRLLAAEPGSQGTVEENEQYSLILT